jgi:hypothetical protein
MMESNGLNNKGFERLSTKHLEKLRERIRKQQENYFENLKKDFINKPAPGQTIEEMRFNRSRLLNYVHRYVFLQKLEPFYYNSRQFEQIVLEKSRVRKFLRYFLWVKTFLVQFLQLRSVLLILSAVFFFFAEYVIYKYSLVSYKDVNITFQDIINKIPPFF